MAEVRHIVITGANSPIGQRLLSSDIWAVSDKVTAIVTPWSDVPSERSYDMNVQVLQRDLSAPFDEPLRRVLAEADAVIHLAWLRAARREEAIEKNTVIAERLLDAMEAPERMAFLSSVAAAARQVSAYGSAKHAVEKIVRSRGGYVIVSGLVSAEPPFGPDAMLRQAIRNCPLRPVFLWPRVPVFVTPIAWIVGAAGRFVDGLPMPNVSRVYGLPVPDLNDLVCEVRGRDRLSMPVPVFCMNWTAKVLRILPVAPIRRITDKVLTFFDKSDVEELRNLKPAFDDMEDPS